MHAHFSALNVLNTFLAVLLAGTFWRLLALHLQASPNPSLAHAGAAMNFQY
jgi:hypothetical protein